MNIRVIKKTSRGDVTKIILETVKVSGLLATALVVPNVVVAFKKLGIIDIGREKKQVITTARIRLIKNGYLEKNYKGFLTLTKKGEEKLKSFELTGYQLVIPRIWDRKWRVLIFDIPESRRSIRTKVRNTLRSVGFKRIQDSVWVFPHDCSELVSLLKADFRIGKDLLYMVVDEIENDKILKDYFKLR